MMHSSLLLSANDTPYRRGSCNNNSWFDNCWVLPTYFVRLFSQAKNKHSNCCARNPWWLTFECLTGKCTWSSYAGTTISACSTSSLEHRSPNTQKLSSRLQPINHLYIHVYMNISLYVYNILTYIYIHAIIKICKYIYIHICFSLIYTLKGIPRGWGF